MSCNLNKSWWFSGLSVEYCIYGSNILNLPCVEQITPIRTAVKDKILIISNTFILFIFKYISVKEKTSLYYLQGYCMSYMMDFDFLCISTFIYNACSDSGKLSESAVKYVQIITESIPTCY